MKKEVRLSRAEQKRARTILKGQTYPDRKAESRNRFADVRDCGDIFVEHGVPDPVELKDVIDKLILQYRDGGVLEEDYDKRIFDPELLSLTDLPIGLLDHKEEALPLELLPQGKNGKEELRALCERMIIRNRNKELINLVVSGWPGETTPDEKLDGHVSDLWRLSQADFDLYRSIVCSQHGQALKRVKLKGPRPGFSEKSLIRILVRHGLLWCTNDIQLILARNTLAERNPLGKLISSDYLRLEPTRVVNDLRPHYLLLRLTLDLYVTTAAASEGQEEPTEVPDDPIASLLRSRIEHYASTRRIDLMALRTKLDVLIPYLRIVLRKGGRRLRRELEKPVRANELEKHFHGIWFSGLSNVQASAVPLLRYVQAEAELEQMIRDLLPLPGRRVEARLGTGLPAFSENRLSDGWRKRVKDMLYAYRLQFMTRSDARSDLAKPGRSKNAGWAAIQKASNFLTERGERLVEDCAGKETCPRRTFYLLDVIPEARLHR